MRLAKQGPAALLSHIEFMAAVERALRRARWPLCHSQGFHPKPRLSFGPACPVGVESLVEWTEVQLQPPVDPDDLLRRLGGRLPAGVAVLEAAVAEPGAPRLSSTLRTVRYRLRLGGAVSAEGARAGAARLLQRSSWRLWREVRGEQREVELRPSLRSLRVLDGSAGVEAVLDLSLDSGPAPRPGEVSAEAFGIDRPVIVREALSNAPLEEP
jgi:radical SAM-linked protein